MKLSVNILQVEQVTQSYVDWYSNEEVVGHSDNQYRSFSLDGQCAYVESCLQSDDVNLYGIFDRTTHIGNVTLNGLSSYHQRAELSYVIGETLYWNKGVATFAIAEIIKIVKSDFNLS